jgi:hypothetical protein
MSVDVSYLHDGVEDDIGDALLGTDLATRAPEATQGGVRRWMYIYKDVDLHWCTQTFPTHRNISNMISVNTYTHIYIYTHIYYNSIYVCVLGLEEGDVGGGGSAAPAVVLDHIVRAVDLRSQSTFKFIQNTDRRFKLIQTNSEIEFIRWAYIVSIKYVRTQS